MARCAQGLNLSDIMESGRIPEALFDEAYQSTDPNHKALLKRGIQCAFQVFGRELSFSRMQGTDAHAGIRRDTVQRPVDWTILLVDGTSSAAARLAAAALLPRLAGVPDVVAVSTDAPPPAPGLLSLELAGVEDIFVLTEEELAACLARRGGRGRICCLARRMPASLHGWPVLLTERRPDLALLSPGAFDTETLAFMHGFVPDTPGEGTDLKEHDAVFADRETCSRLIEDPDCRVSLLLSPGFEGFWLHPARPADFLLKKQAFFPSRRRTSFQRTRKRVFFFFLP